MFRTLPAPPLSDPLYGFELFPAIVGGGLLLAVLIGAAILTHAKVTDKSTWRDAWFDWKLSIGIAGCITVIVAVFVAVFIGGSANDAHNDARKLAWAKTFVACVKTQYGITLPTDAAIKLTWRNGRVDAVVDDHIVELKLVPTANEGYVLTADGSLLRNAH